MPTLQDSSTSMVRELLLRQEQLEAHNQQLEENQRLLAQSRDRFAALYQDAQRALRKREELLAIVSHDLRTPISAVLLNTDLLLAECAGEEGSPERKHLEAIKHSAKRLGRMVGDLLDLSSIDSGHLSLELERLQMAAMVMEALEMLRPLAMEKSQQLDVQLAGEDCPVLCDRGRVVQVLSNLVGNSIKFTPPEGAIAVRSERRGSEVRVSVSDTGPGMTPAVLSHVFDPYWTAPDAASPGLGLGLFIAKSIVEAHGGRIWAETQRGVGSTFYFSLPAAADRVTRK